MRKLITILLVVFCQVTFGQVYQIMPQYGYSAPRMNFDSTLTIPTFNGVPTLKSNITRKGAVAIDSTNGRFYFYNPKTLVWDTIRGGGGTTSATKLITSVYNNTGSTIAKGSVVYISGRHSSNLPTIALAEANNEDNSYKTFALVQDDIPTSNSGIVIQAGRIDNLNLPTSIYTDGDIVYLSPSVPGGITTTKPLAPNHICKIGSIVRAHPTFGAIEIKIENGWQMDELSDVKIAVVPNDSTILQFSRVDSLWHDVSINNAIGSKYLKPSDSTIYQTKFRSDSARTNIYTAINVKLNALDTASLSNRINTKLNSSDTASLSNRINTKLNLSDSTIYQTKFRSDTARTNIYITLNGKLNISDSSIYQPKFRSDSARTNTYSALSTKHNLSDSVTYQTKFRSDTARTNVWNQLAQELNISDSATYYTKFRSDSSRTNIYTAIAGKFTLPSLTSGSVLFSNGTTIAQKNANLYWDNSFNRLGIGTNAPTTLLQLTQSNTDYTNTNGAGSHIYMTNTSATGQNVVASFINGSMVAKWRTDYQGNISWVAGSTGAHDFYTKGDFGTGQIMMRIFNGGNVQIATSSVGGGNSDAGFKLDVQGTFKSTGRYTAYVSKTGAYTATTTDEVISADATSAAFQITLPTAVSKAGQTYTIKRANAGANAVTVGTTSSQTIDGSTTYSLSAQYKYVTVVSNGANWLIISNN